MNNMPIKKLLIITLTFPLLLIPLAKTVSAETLPSQNASGSGLRESFQTQKTLLEEQKEASVEAMAAQKEESKNNLDGIKDVNKRMILEKLDTQVASLSANRTEKMSAVLDSITAVLDKIVAAEALLRDNGTDTINLNNYIEDAKKAIAKAQDAVLAQEQKQYSIPITDENALKSNVGSVLKQLQKDLMVSYKAAIVAKQDTMKAAKELSKLRKFMKGGKANGTKSATRSAE